MRNFIIGACMTAAALLAACGGSGDTTGPSQQPGTVVTSATVRATPSIQFTPATVNLAVGGTITFAFESVPHNLYFDGAPAGAPGNITAPSSNVSVTRTFSAKGRYVYNCHLHPGMSGVVVVQ
jgi:plastocyanin